MSFPLAGLGLRNHYRIQQWDRPRHAEVGGHGLEIRAHLALILADGLKQYNPPRDVDVQKAGLPTVFGDLLSLDLKGSSLLDTAQQAVAEVDLGHDVRVYFHQTLALRLDPDLPRQALIYAGLVGRGIVSRIGPE